MLAATALALAIAADVPPTPDPPGAALPAVATDPATATHATDDATRFQCDGTDPFFFDELNKAGVLGYGETWDESVCDEGIAVYSEGTQSRWSAFKPRRVRASSDDQLLAFAVPAFVFGGLGLVFGIAGMFAFIARLRRRVVLDVSCPGCATGLPVSLDDAGGAGGHQMFCPMCGVGVAVDLRGKGRAATAHARPLF